ncbi:MAG TPA: aldo/keto reductase [Allosphingosinicella sp.]|nr:aldo/keto reductase [Allosphingosinicella sp.]
MPELRPLGRTALSTPRLVLGGNVFGWTADRAESFRLLDRFADAGGTLVDTADVYSAWAPGHKGGESESLIGEWLKRRGSSQRLAVATKVGMLPGEGGEKLAPARIAAAADASLKRLGVEAIDLYYAHQDDPDTPMDAALQAFDALVRAGKVKALGASNFTAERLEQALNLAGSLGTARYEVLQPEYHLLAREAFEDALQPLCLREGLSVLPYYGLASGFLTGKYRSEKDFGKSVRGPRMAKYLAGGGPAVLAALDEIAGETGATQAQIALAWLAAQPAVAAPIASATSVAQLDELIGAMTLDLSADQLARLDDASRG